MVGIAQAHSNIALVKYWGKRDQRLNLPAVGSISVTLRALYTISTVRFDKHLEKDILVLNGREASSNQTERVSRFLNLVRTQSGSSNFAEIHSENNFPTGAGLASSASSFASLALAATRAAELDLSPSRMSELARRGSGSAARSIFGGFVEMKIGERADGSDAVAVQLADENYWDIRILVAITSEKKKEFTSTEGMMHTAKTSPFYRQWIFSSQQDLEELRSAIFAKNFKRLGEISEHSCLKMHSVALSSKPALIYWTDATLAAINAIRRIQKKSVSVYFTIDAGPQVKVLCLPKDAEYIKKQLENTSGVLRVIESGLGPGAELVENHR